MKITQEQIDEVVGEVEDYESRNLVRFGDDFAAMAATLMASKSFSTIMLKLVITAAVHSMEAGPNMGNLNPEMARRKLCEGPLRPEAAKLIYIGYKLGKRDAEIETLEKLT